MRKKGDTIMKERQMIILWMVHIIMLHMPIMWKVDLGQRRKVDNAQYATMPIVQFRQCQLCSQCQLCNHNANCAITMPIVQLQCQLCNHNANCATAMPIVQQCHLCNIFGIEYRIIGIDNANYAA